MGLGLEFQKSKNVPLVPCEQGRHKFGGKTRVSGAVPRSADTPIHHLLDLDLADQLLPIRSEKVTSLPLLFPLWYGFGGPEIQYVVLGDNEIDIVYLSDLSPDVPDDRNVQVAEFPEMMLRSSQEFATEIGRQINIGQDQIVAGEKPFCKNTKCRVFSKEEMKLVATIPPILIEGHPDIWWDFEGADMVFSFWNCQCCDSIYAETCSC